MTFDDVYESYKIYASKRHKKQCFDTLTQNFNKYVLTYFKDKSLNDLTIQDVISWQDYILDFNFSNNYNKNIYCSFNSFLNYCLLNSYITTNYLKILGSFKKKLEYKEHNIYTKREYKKFRKGLDNRIYRYFFDILFYYGLRSGEAMALKFSSLNFNILHVGSSMQRRGKREIDVPKTKNSDRYLKLDLKMIYKLFVLKCYYIKKYGVSVYDYFIFGGKTPLSPTSIKRHKHKACKIVGIKEITTHEFRHSCATRMVKRKPIKYVSSFLGHSSVAITLDVYVHNEKRDKLSFHCKFDFFNTLTQNFKKILQSIITHFIV